MHACTYTRAAHVFLCVTVHVSVVVTVTVTVRVVVNECVLCVHILIVLRLLCV